MTLGPLRFTNASGGTSDWVYPGPTIDLQSPASAQAVNGTTYLIYAEALDRSQWEIATGAYTSAGGTFARTTVLFNSLGTTAKINFGKPPQVYVFETGAAASPSTWTRTVLAGSGTYNTPAGCKAIRVQGVGGGGGGGGANTLGAAGANGGNTTFGTSLLTANGGTGGPKGGNVVGAPGGTVSGGDINIIGGNGSTANSVDSSNPQGPTGGASFFGGGGTGGAGGAGGGTQGNAPGSGGGGGAPSAGVAAMPGSGAAGGYFDKLIVNPSASYNFVVGAGGAAGPGNTGGSGGAGAGGLIIVDEYY